MIRNILKRIGPGIIVICFALACLIALLMLASRTYEPLDFTEEGMASWYGPDFKGSETASGSKFRPWDYTAEATKIKR